jgi:hypothetical protein
MSAGCIKIRDKAKKTVFLVRRDKASRKYLRYFEILDGVSTFNNLITPYTSFELAIFKAMM